MLQNIWRFLFFKKGDKKLINLTVKKDEILFDRIVLQQVLSKDNSSKILEKLKEYKALYIKNLNDFNSYYYLKDRKGRFNIKYFIRNKILVLDFNFQKFFYNENIGILDGLKVQKVITYLNDFLEGCMALNLNVKDFRVKNLELKKDVLCKNRAEKQMLINTFKKMTRGHFKENFYEDSTFKYNKNNKICVYNKKNELIEHNNYNNLTENEKEYVENLVRVEVALSQKKLQKMLGEKEILFKNILCTNIQKKIFCDYFNNFNFSSKILTENELINKIKELDYSDKKIDNLIKFVGLLNRMSFNRVKMIFKSAYSYLQILKENGLSAYFVDFTEVLFKIIKDKKERVYCNRYSKFKNEYNIYTQINKTVTKVIKLRI